MDGNLSVRWFGAIGDDQSHPLANYYATLQHAQAVYPHATSLSDEIDWAAIQAAIEHFIDTTYQYHAVWIPRGVYKLSRPLLIGRDNTFLNCHLMGVPNAFTAEGSPVAGVVLQLSSLTLPVLVIQGARAVLRYRDSFPQRQHGAARQLRPRSRQPLRR